MSAAVGAAIGAVALGAWQYTRELEAERACHERANTAPPGSDIELCLYFPGATALVGAVVGAGVGAAIGWAAKR